MRAVTRFLLVLVPASAALAPLRAQDAKVESQLMLPPQPGMQYEISPQGQHVAGVVLRGSRQVLVHDGTDGPRFDQVLKLPAQAGNGQSVAWSDDGTRWAYHAKVGQEYVILVDGKEVSRGPWSADLQQVGRTPVYDLGFSPAGKHWFVTLQARTPARQTWQLLVDGVAGPVTQGEFTPLWSPDGEHHTYHQQIFPASGPTRYVLIIDGKPAPYLAGDMQWTGDSKHLISKRPIPGGDVVEVLANGQPLMRVPGGVNLTMAPVGPALLGVAWTPFQGSSRNAYLIVGNKRAVGSECSNSAGLDQIYISADAKHYAARCPQTFMFVDGKKGQDYPEGVSNLVFTADGRPVYFGKTNQRVFMVVGDKESDAYGRIVESQPATREEQRGNFRAAPAVVRGSHVAYIAGVNPNDNNSTVVVVDGKAWPAVNATYVSLSPDGSRFAFISGRPTQGVTVDGTAYASAAVDPGIANVGYQGAIQWSPDSKHVAWVANMPGMGVAIDGRFVAAPGMMRFVHFTADGKHLVWLMRSPTAPEHLVFLDGVKVLTIPQNLSLEGEADIYWGFGADGSISFVAQDNEGMKRFRIVPGGTSVETAAAKGVPIK